MAKLTTKQKKEIVSKYATGGTSFRKLAKEYKVAPHTIEKVVKQDPDFAAEVDSVKKDSEQSMLEYIASKSAHVQHIIGSVLKTFTDTEINKMLPRDRAGLLKILIEQFTPKDDTMERNGAVQVSINLKDTSVATPEVDVSQEGQELI